MVLTGCLRSVEAAYKTINWETIVLFGAMLPMSLALEKTGVSQHLADALAGSIGGYGPTALLAGVYFTTSLMTMFISNTVTAVLMAPIALQSAIQAGVSPVPFLFAVTVAASMCFASPFSTPCGDRGGQYVFRLSLLHAAQCVGNARRTILLCRLRKGRASLTGHHGIGDDSRASVVVPFLNNLS